MENHLTRERSYAFEPLTHLYFSINNCCRIRIIDEEREDALVTFQGDPTFMEYHLVEMDGDRLRITVKNPSGSAFRWEPYDRGGYEGENLITIHTGVAKSNCYCTSFLDLVTSHWLTDEGRDEWVICTKEEMETLCPGFNQRKQEPIEVYAITRPMK